MAVKKRSATASLGFAILRPHPCRSAQVGVEELFRSVTSVAANYAEASEPESDADFIHKLKVSLKELKETRVWLRFAKELLCDGSVDDIVAETFEIARMMGASMRKRGYSGWASA